MYPGCYSNCFIIAHVFWLLQQQLQLNKLLVANFAIAGGLDVKALHSHSRRCEFNPQSG